MSNANADELKTKMREEDEPKTKLTEGDLSLYGYWRGIKGIIS